MKTNVSIELDDEALVMLADKIDGKHTQRKATRKEIVEVCQQMVQGLVHHELAQQTGVQLNHFERWSKPDPEDSTILAGKSPGFIYGWNKVKHGLTTTRG